MDFHLSESRNTVQSPGASAGNAGQKGAGNPPAATGRSIRGHDVVKR